MPNTVVKLINAESTWPEAAREDRKLLIKERRDSQGCESFFVVYVREGRDRRGAVSSFLFALDDGFTGRGINVDA